MDPTNNVSVFSSDSYDLDAFPQDSGSSSPVAPSTSASHGRKRRRLSRLSGTNISPEVTCEENQGETEATTPVDLTEGPSALSKTLAKQREDAVKAQQGTEHEGGRSLLTAYRCPVCMDTPVDATSTACGI